jgi:hypothetical protein
MNPALLVLALSLASTTASATPAGTDEETQNRRAASAPRVREVRFEGELAFEPGTLKKVLEGLAIRRVIPGIWTRRPRYDSQAVEADLVRLRSFYFSRGYFDARVDLGGVTVDGDEASPTIEIHSGPRYFVRRIEIDGMWREDGELATGPAAKFAAGALCRSLIDARRLAESHGRLDFSVALELSDPNESARPEPRNPSVNVTARVQMGAAYTVGRIDFSGHYRINDSTLRRAFALRERSILNVEKLRQSLASLNRSGLVDPLTTSDIGIRRHPDTLTADLTIPVRERLGRWSLSGPLGPTGFLTLLQASISARLPGWGRGPFEASTYYLTFSVLGFSNPLVRALPIGMKSRLPAMLVLERPYLPGQPLLSGFALSPQLSARRTLAAYGLTHLQRATETALIGGARNAADLLVPISRVDSSGDIGESGRTRMLICHAPQPAHWRLRHAIALVADLAVEVFRPF